MDPIPPKYGQVYIRCVISTTNELITPVSLNPKNMIFFLLIDINSQYDYIFNIKKKGVVVYIHCVTFCLMHMSPPNIMCLSL